MPIDRSARGPFVAMAAIAGAVVANIYFAQPMLPLIASSLGAPKASIGLIPGFTLVGFAFGLATLLPLGGERLADGALGLERRRRPRRLGGRGSGASPSRA